jgi:hypothetical protein
MMSGAEAAELILQLVEADGSTPQPAPQIPPIRRLNKQRGIVNRELIP